MKRWGSKLICLAAVGAALVVLGFGVRRGCGAMVGVDLQEYETHILLADDEFEFDQELVENQLGKLIDEQAEARLKELDGGEESTAVRETVLAHQKRLKAYISRVSEVLSGFCDYEELHPVM